MIKAILAIDDKGGVSKDGSMPWPRNTKDLKWFKNNTKGQIVIMGSKTWIDPKMPTPLQDRINILITRKKSENYPGADKYINGNLITDIKNISNEYPKLIKWVIGGPNVVNQIFPIIEEFYLTRIYGDFNCDTFLNTKNIDNKMKIIEKINCDNTCHFEIWAK